MSLPTADIGPWNSGRPHYSGPVYLQGIDCGGRVGGGRGEGGIEDLAYCGRDVLRTWRIEDVVDG